MDNEAREWLQREHVRDIEGRLNELCVSRMELIQALRDNANELRDMARTQDELADYYEGQFK